MSYQYCNENDLVVNANKTKQLTFEIRNVEVTALPDVKFRNSHQVSWNDSWQNLPCNDHIEDLCKKLSSCLFHKNNQAYQRWSHNLSCLPYFFVCQRCKTYINARRVAFEIRLHSLGRDNRKSQSNTAATIKAITIVSEPSPKESCKNVFPSLKILTTVGLCDTEITMHVGKENLRRDHDTHRYSTCILWVSTCLCITPLNMKRSSLTWHKTVWPYTRQHVDI